MSETTTTAAPTPPQKKRAGVGRWIARILIALLVLVVLLIAVIIGALLYFHIPSNASGMAAKSICSAAFVAGRDEDATTLMEQGCPARQPGPPVISTEIDDQQHTVTAKFLGLFPRQASLVTDRGCVLDLPPTRGPALHPKPDDPRAWPEGDGVAKPAEQPEGSTPQRWRRWWSRRSWVRAIQAANARGVAVVQDGRLLALREGRGLPQNVALHGWSMTKSVGLMLAPRPAAERRVDVETPVVDAPKVGEPSWVAQWRRTIARRSRSPICSSCGTAWLSMRGTTRGDPSSRCCTANPTWRRGPRNTPADHEPGTYWEYPERHLEHLGSR